MSRLGVSRRIQSLLDGTHEIDTPGLRDLPISGVFATDDIDGFVAFLRSLRGVQVEVAADRIRVRWD